MIKFYTEHLKPGELSRFSVEIDAPWGLHQVNGSIIHSQRDNRARVMWPKLGDRFAHSPVFEARDDAEKWILAKFSEWNR